MVWTGAPGAWIDSGRSGPPTPRWGPSAVSQSLSRRRERIALSARLRAEGLSWVEVAEVLRSRHGVNARAALRLAHGWSQRQAAEEWNARWPDDLKSAKNFSYW